jgi:hypothetical protein
MSVRQPAFLKAEFTRQGTDWYERLRAQIDPENASRIGAIDILTGDFSIGDDTLAAADQLLGRRPEAQTWFVRICHSGVPRYGRRSWMESS